jgi:hypothetical protein
MRVWRIPLALFALTVFGLASALIGSGVWHIAAWLALAVPTVLAARYSLFPGRSKNGAPRP